MEDRWYGKAFQIFEATDENDLEAAMVVLRVGTHIERHEESEYGNNKPCMFRTPAYQRTFLSQGKRPDS